MAGLLTTVIWVTAASIGLSQFPELRILSAGLLASAGISGLIVGFAARSTLGNAIAGVTISIAQPIRIGDDVEIKSERGVVEDIHFTYTVLRLRDGRRLIIPNEMVASEVIKNATMGGVTRVARPEVLVPPHASPETVRSALLAVANEHEQLDRAATPPEVFYVRVDDRGTLTWRHQFLEFSPEGGRELQGMRLIFFPGRLAGAALQFTRRVHGFSIVRNPVIVNPKTVGLFR